MSGDDNPAARIEDDTTPLDHVRFLTRAESRVRLMEALSESAATQGELRTELDASRTTVSRSLRSLEERGWVKTDDGSYRLTRTGRAIVDDVSELLETVRRAEELSGFLRWFPAEKSAPDFLEANDVTVTLAKKGNPYAPARKQTEILHTADRLRMMLPSIDIEGTRVIHEEVTNARLEAETIVSPGLEATIESDEFAPLLREKIGTGRSTVLVSETELPFYLGMADDGRVQIGVEDDEGFPRALLETTDGSVAEWAEDVYRTYREQARRKPIEAFE